MGELPNRTRKELKGPGKALILQYAQRLGEFDAFKDIPVKVLSELLRDPVFASAAASAGGGESFFRTAIGRRIDDLTEASRHALGMVGGLDPDDRETQFELVDEAMVRKKPTPKLGEDFPF